jgi:hypothetical protein
VSGFPPKATIETWMVRKLELSSGDPDCRLIKATSLKRRSPRI